MNIVTANSCDIFHPYYCNRFCRYNKNLYNCTYCVFNGRSEFKETLNIIYGRIKKNEGN